MTPATVIRLVLGACALAVIGVGALLAVAGGGSNIVAVASRGDEAAFALPTASGAGTPVAGSSAVGEATGTSDAGELAPATAAARPTADPVAPPPRVSDSAGTAAPVPATTSPVVTDLPAMSANEVLALSRSVRLPSGRTFEACGAMGPEGQPWPFSVHLYYTGHGGWVVGTHLGDAALMFDEATRAFLVEAVTRAGC